MVEWVYLYYKHTFMKQETLKKQKTGWLNELGSWIT